MFNKNIIIPINKDYDDRGFVPCENQVKEFTNFEELINFVAYELDYLNIPHRVMNKEYE